MSADHFISIKNLCKYYNDGAIKALDNVSLDIEKGEAVHINSGAFEGFAATVAEVFPDKYKLKVLVEMFGRETTVELDFDQVDKI